MSPTKAPVYVTWHERQPGQGFRDKNKLKSQSPIIGCQNDKHTGLPFVGMTMTLNPACMWGNSLESIKGPELPQELIFCVQTGQERQATPCSRGKSERGCQPRGHGSAWQLAGTQGVPWSCQALCRPEPTLVCVMTRGKLRRGGR